ncbi:MAG: TetR/AcrR family transcriptional regulator [Gammaproteobacteria bacterium]|nr:MAG: TetR/AcrR family transcriptional regulator [Gammaproteobacteria bacterium]
MNQGRPREFDIDRALESATRQFWAVGYEATSMADLLQAMKLSKSSLYQTFGSKEALFIRCLQYFQTTMANDLLSKLESAASPRQFLVDYLQSVIDEASRASGRKGCLLVNTANELAQRNPAIRDAVSEGAAQMMKVFASALERAVAQGEIHPSQSVEDLTRYYFSSVSGLRTMVKAGASREELEPIANLVMTTLQ